MKAHEAIAILEAIDQDQEVTLILVGNKRVAKQGSGSPTNAYLPGQAQPYWVIGHNFWPNKNEITCKMH